MLVPAQHSQCFGWGKLKDACSAQGRRGHCGPTLELYAAAFSAVPGLAQECPQEPLISLIPPAPPTDGVQKEVLLCALPPQTLCSALDAHPLARFPPALKSMYFPTPGEGFLVQRCPCAASDRHSFTIHSHSIHSEPPDLVGAQAEGEP